MIELSRHIENLLLVHNCVIVPNLGGFVAQNCPARYIEEEELFLPPYRNVAFNPLLQLNDGLLAQSYMHANGMTYAEALHAIDRDVEELRKSIETRQVAELNGIGTLRSTANGEYDFTPVEAGVAAPSYYGLSSFSMPRLSEKRYKKLHKASSARLRKDLFSKYYTVRIHKAALRRFAAAAAIVTVFYFLWAAPLNNSIHHGRQEAQMFEPITQLLTPAPATSSPTTPTTTTAATPPAVEKSTQAPSPTVAPAPAAATADSVTVAPPADPPKEAEYTIVLASQVTQRGAAEFVQQLKKAGFTQARVFHKQKMTRVLYGSYANARAAQEGLRALRRTDSRFAQAWVLQP